MSFFQSPNFLRHVLLADAATCTATGALMTLGSGVLARLTSVPPSLFWYAGLSLFPVAAFIAFVATRPLLSTPAVWLVVVGNIAWIAGSVWLMLGNAINPNAFGYVFIAFQAVAVAVLTELEYVGVRRNAGVPASS